MTGCVMMKVKRAGWSGQQNPSKFGYVNQQITMFDAGVGIAVLGI
jgi:hypothetical protein